MAEFISTLGRLHRDYGRRQTECLTLQELLRKHPAPPGLSNRTLNRHVPALTGLFKWAERAGMVESNPAAGHQRTVAKGKRRRPFTPAELAVLLRERPDPRPETHTTRTALPWLCWLGAYTGARLDELAGLRVADVKERDGILYLDLVDHPGRRLKTPAATRKVPVHSYVLAAGFREYTEYVRSQGHEYLFPGLKRGGPARKLGWYAGRAMADQRQKLGLDCLDFHSLRGTVATALHEAGVPEVEAAAILGHELRTMSYGLYSGGLSLAKLREVVERIGYPGLRPVS